MSESARCLVLTGSQTLPARGAALVCRWNGYDESDGSVSVPVYLDANAERIRGRYLALIHALGVTPLRGRTLVEHFALQRGYNLWHMSLIVEKSPFKSARVIDCVKLLAFEEMLEAHGAARVRLDSLDNAVAEAVRGLCKTLGIALEGGAPPVKTRRDPLAGRTDRAWLRLLPHPVRACVFLLHHLRVRWPLRQVRRGWLEQQPLLGMFSYFFNIDARQAEVGRFHSPQWGGFPEFLAAQGVRTNWLEHFVHGGAMRDPRTALRWAERFNAESGQLARHVFVDAELGLVTVARALANYLLGWWRAARLRGVARLCVAPGSRASLWPLMRDDWRASTRGWPALQAALWIELFDAALASMPRLRAGLYLQENQGWERALLHAWRRHGHGTLVGVAHSTVRFWDLRYFDDPAAFSSSADLPRPDLVAINGPHAKEMLQRSGHPADQLVEVEALRYLHLEKHQRTSAPPAAAGPVATGSSPLRLLVVGDSMRSAAEELLESLAIALAQCGRRVEVRFKPHPFTPIDLSRFALPGAQLCAGAMDELIAGSDALLGAISSAMIEGYCLGAQPIIFLGHDTVNFSPLVGVEDVLVVRNSQQLARALETAGRGTGTARRAYFHIDSRLPRWRELLRRLNIGAAV